MRYRPGRHRRVRRGQRLTSATRRLAVQYGQYRLVGNPHGRTPAPSATLAVLDGNVTVTCLHEDGRAFVRSAGAPPPNDPPDGWDASADIVVDAPAPVMVTSWEGEPQPPALTPTGGRWRLQLLMRALPDSAAGDPQEEHLWVVRPER